MYYDVIYKQDSIARFLIESGADLDVAGKNGHTVRYIMKENNTKLYKYIEAHKKFLNEKFLSFFGWGGACL